MAEADNLVLVSLRRLDEMLDRVIDAVCDLKTRVSDLGEKVARQGLARPGSIGVRTGSRRASTRRLELAETPH